MTKIADSHMTMVFIFKFTFQQQPLWGLVSPDLMARHTGVYSKGMINYTPSQVLVRQSIFWQLEILFQYFNWWSGIHSTYAFTAKAKFTIMRGQISRQQSQLCLYTYFFYNFLSMSASVFTIKKYSVQSIVCLYHILLGSYEAKWSKWF